MSSVERSLDLLDEALTKLERALMVRLTAEGQRFDALQAEHEALRTDYAALKSIAGRASDKLEHTLSRIDQYLKVAADGAS
jgi:hypothetical protein